MVVKHGALPPHTPWGLTNKVPAARVMIDGQRRDDDGEAEDGQQLDSRTDAREGPAEFRAEGGEGDSSFHWGNPFCLEALARADDSGRARKLSDIRAHVSVGVSADGHVCDT